MLRLKKIIGFSLLGLYIVVMMSFANIAYNEKTCTGIEVIIEDSVGTHFVQKHDVMSILDKGGYQILTKRPHEVDLHTIENDIKNHPSIKDCDCYFTSGSTFKVMIDQRHPIARIMTDNYNFYIDDAGGEMPPSKFYTAHVPIITGEVDKSKVSSELYHLAKVIHNDPFWSAQIVQIDINKKGEYTLIPRAGRQVIELGDANNLETKFKSLKALYLQIFNNNSWNKYKTISLKYDGQVVCTKK